MTNANRFDTFSKAGEEEYIKRKKSLMFLIITKIYYNFQVK